MAERPKTLKDLTREEQIAVRNWIEQTRTVTENRVDEEARKSPTGMITQARLAQIKRQAQRDVPKPLPPHRWPKQKL
nr:hypothetical protein [Oscillochloris trichoides]